MLDLSSTMERVVEVGNKGESQYKQSWMIDCIVLECDAYVLKMDEDQWRYDFAMYIHI